jgi:hypothetical protein
MDTRHHTHWRHIQEIVHLVRKKDFVILLDFMDTRSASSLGPEVFRQVTIFPGVIEKLNDCVSVIVSRFPGYALAFLGSRQRLQTAEPAIDLRACDIVDVSWV